MQRRARRYSTNARIGLPFVVAIGMWLLLACGSQGASPSASTGPSSASAPAAGSGAQAPAQTGAPPQPTKVRVAFSQVYPGITIPWTTQEAGIYAKHGLDVEMTYIASTQTVPAALAGEVDISLGGGYAVVNSNLGGSDLKMFLGFVNWYPYELMVAPEINSVDDLRGKALGVSRFGSASDVATRVALQKFGLAPERDVIILQTGSMQERVAAMKAGAVVGGVASPPDPTILRREGFKSLLSLAALGEQEMNVIAFAGGRWLQANEATAQAYVNASIEGIHFAKNNPDFTRRVLATELKLDDDEVLTDSYEHYVGNNLARVPDPGRDATRKYLEQQAASAPRASGARIEDFFDMRFIERAQASGLVEQLYGGR